MKTFRIVALLTVSTLTGLTARAAEEATPPAAPAPETAAATAPAPASDKVVIEYIEADIQNVLRSLASRAGINLILGDEVQGKVTVHLEDIGYEDAMKLIVESKGFGYIKDNKIVKVKSKESLDTEPLELRLVPLNYAKAEEVMKALQQVLTSRGKAQVDARSNTLILSDTPSNLAKLIPLVQQLDSETPQVMIEAKFVETSKNPRKDLGINWTDTLLKHEVSTQDFSLNKNLNGGPWTWGTPATAFLDIGQAKIVFSYMSQDQDTELLASPRVVTTDNGKAKLSIAKQVPIPNFTFSEQTASLQISGFTYKDIGIILNVTPRINKNEYVTLEVSPEASSQTGNQPLTSGQGNTVNIPIVSTRQATTTVLIKSGHTLAIGGLMQTDVDDSYTKVPLLGDIPGVGRLFRSKSLSKTKRDLLIFLTPTIIAPDAKTGLEANYNGFPAEEVYANDKWMPKDNAKPRQLLKAPAAPSDDKKSGPAQTNFGPK